MSNLFRNFCWIVGSEAQNMFPVKISREDTVGDLKIAIKIEASPMFQSIPAYSLVLYKVTIAKHDLRVLETIDLAGLDALLPADNISEVLSDSLPDNKIEIVIARPPADFGRGSAKRRIDITSDIMSRWTKVGRLDLPSVDELPGILDRPLQEADKIPLRSDVFDNLLAGGFDMREVCGRSDVEKVFRISDEEWSPMLEHYSVGVVVPGPPAEETEGYRSFVGFWDANFRWILERLLPSGRSIRNSNLHTKTGTLRPDYGFLLNNICAFRGEEKAPMNTEDPSVKLSNKLTWVYHPAPYVFGYYATGADVALVAICAPPTSSQGPFVRDLASVNLGIKRDRIANLRRLINLCPYITTLVRVIGFRRDPEFTKMMRNGKTVEIGTNAVTKTYLGNDRIERLRYIQNIYYQLKDKGVPHVDALTLINEGKLWITLEPKGIPVAPSSEKEVLDAVICVLQALKVLHQPPSLFHRDIRWPNVLRQANDPNLWFLIDWEDAVGSNNMAAKHFCKENHSPSVFVDNHGGEVDIWGVGFLIKDLALSPFNISSELADLGKWMQNDAPSAQEALTAVEKYRKRLIPQASPS